MDNTLKFYLLAEVSGWDTSAYAFNYGKTYTQLKAYQVFSYNVIEAKQHLSPRAQNMVREFENLKIEPRSLQEAFVLETRLNYLALHSFPEYYLNPLAIDPNYSGEINSIGDLMVEIQGQDLSINELIQDNHYSLEDKKEAVGNKISQDLEDMNHLVNDSLTMVKQRAFEKKDTKADVTKVVLGILFFILVNFFFAFTLVYPFKPYWECYYHFQSNHAMSYTSHLLPITLYLYDFVFVLFHTYKAKVSEPFNYARRFLRRNSEKVFSDINETSEKLYDYIVGAINNHLILRNDIRDFSKLSTSYVDFRKVINVNQLKERKAYRRLHLLNNIFTTIIGVVAVVSFIIYLIGCLVNQGF